MSENLPVEHNDEDEFDKIFFSTHGVGHDPLSEEERKLIHSLDNTKATWQEIEFVRTFFREGNITDAYIKAFNFDGTEHRRDYFTRLANRLLERPRVIKKLNEYREKAQALADEDVSKLVHELNEDRNLARSLGQPSAAIAATKAKASLLGLEQSSVNNMNVILELSDDQKQNLLSRIGKRLSNKVSNEEIIEAEYRDVSEG